MHESHLKNVEMSFLRSVVRYTKLDRRKNEDIRHELVARRLNDMVRVYRQKECDHVGRVNLSRIPHVSEKYMAEGRRILGRRLENLRDQL